VAGADLVTISDGVLSAQINPLGAELWSLTDAEGREYMTDADPAFWTGHAPLLFPIVGALNGGRFRLGGKEYALAKHGFARTSRFDLIDLGPAYVHFRLRACDATRTVWPFEFQLDAEFALSDVKLSTIVTVSNQSKQPMPFSFGFHPAFAWPLPGGGAKDAHRVIFARDEPAPVRRIDPVRGVLLADVEPTPVVDRELAPHAAMFEADALIWDKLASRSVRFTSAGGPSLTIDFPDCPHLGIWQKPGAPFLAIEPWHGFNDPDGVDGDLGEKPGTLTLEPGREKRFRMDVTVHRV